MHSRMAAGKSVHIKGLGYFRYSINSKGVKTLEEFDFQKQVQAIRVEFIPEREKSNSGNHYTRALVDSDELEWIELSSSAEDSTPEGGTDDSGDDGAEGGNPL